MAANSVIIIGAGIAGLSAGCYGQMNGYRTQVFEMNDKPGGLCTSWSRGGYTVDGCIQWLVGSFPGSSFHHIWEELGAVQGRTFVRPEEYMRIEGRGGTRLTFYADIDRTRDELAELAPEDERLIDEFVNGARGFSRLNVPVNKAPETRKLLDKMRVLPMMLRHVGDLSRWGGVSIGDFARSFKNEALRTGFSLLWFPEFTMSFLLAALGWMRAGVCGYPVGGSLGFARAIEERYRLLGGEVHYKRRVKKVLVEGGRAVGVRFEDEGEARADRVISAADGRSTIFGMLEGKYVGDEVQGYYERLVAAPSVIHVALGVRRVFDELPCSAMGLSLALSEPTQIGDKKRSHLLLHVYSHDPGLAPEGRTLVKVTLVSDLSYWEKLLADPHRYDDAKKEVGDKVLSLLDERFPGLKAQTEMLDIATPITFQRYTGNWRGSICGWMIRPDNWNLRMRRTLPGLEDLYMAGHWVDPIGVPMAALSGRNVIHVMCRKDRKVFGATVP